MSYQPMIIDGKLKVKVGTNTWKLATKRQCQYCGKGFYSPIHTRLGEGKYCSRQCQSFGRTTGLYSEHPTKHCAICGDEFSLKRSQASRIKTCGKPECIYQLKSIVRTQVWEKKREDKMKLGNLLKDKSRENIVEIAQGNNTEPASKSWEQSHRALLYIKHNPGVTISQVQRNAGYKSNGGCYDWVQRSIKSGKIKGKVLDGKLRLYARNYILAEDKPKPKVIELPKAMMSPAAPHATSTPEAIVLVEKKKEPEIVGVLENVAKDYAWERNNALTTGVLKDFIAWVKEKL